MNFRLVFRVVGRTLLVEAVALLLQLGKNVVAPHALPPGASQHPQHQAIR